MPWPTRENPSNVTGRRCLLLLLTWSMYCGCRPKESADGPDHLQSYYDISTFVYDQAHILDSLRPTLHKRATINGSTERAALVPDSAVWMEELDPLLKLDLNEPHLVDLYDVSRSGDVVRYTSRKSGETRVDHLEIGFDNEGLPARVTADIANENPLFSMYRSVEFVFTQVDDAHLLHSYKIAGWQKMALLDTNRIEAFAEVQYGR